MKKLSEEATVFLFMIGIPLIIVLIGMVSTDLYSKYLNNYNTQKDREMFLKTYEIVMECRKNSTVINMDKVCGTVPVFVDKVK
jgi:hypothetical protein